MPRKKNYQAGERRVAPTHRASAAQGALQPVPILGEARIDMPLLLGENARFAREERSVNLSNWLGRRIDAWVWAGLACLKALLLSGSRETSTVVGYGHSLANFFAYLTEGHEAPRVATPAELSPLHIQEFADWLQKRAQAAGWAAGSARNVFKTVKPVLLEMFSLGFIPQEPTRFFKRATLPWRYDQSRHTSLSDAEQEHLAQAIKSDLVALHHGRLALNPMDVQALRLLLIAHRQGLNPTPLLELRRNAMAPGILPGTVRIRTVKHRNKKVQASVGRAAPEAAETDASPEQDMAFPLAEGVILQLAIKSTVPLLAEAPTWCKNRVWLYRSLGSPRSRKGAVTCLTTSTLQIAIRTLIARHGLVGDDGQPLRLNLSRLRKGYFDRALRLAEGDLTITANLMGNTPRVAAVNYPSMNDARKGEAAGFMNEDYISLMRGASAVVGGDARSSPRVIEVKPLKVGCGTTPDALPENTPVSGCRDTLYGEHAPRDGHNHCDRYVMCLFCSSFAVVGTVDELWRLFSFQTFARAELEHLDATLGPLRTSDEELEDLRDRYRLAILFIDDFTRRQFTASNVALARARAAAGLHPYWVHQIALGRQARARLHGPERGTAPAPESNTTDDRHGA